MSLTPEARARAAGVELSWTDAYGQSRRLSEQTLRGLLDALQWPQSGRHGPSRKRANIGMLTADMGRGVQVPTVSGKVTSAIVCDEMGNKHAVRINEHGRFQAPHRPGYYDLYYASNWMRLAVAPPRCFGVADRLASNHARSWGLSAQVYALRREGDGGLGDSSAVAELARSLAQAGGHALSLSPMHATKRTAAVYSPYTPSHRGFLDWIYADPAQILGQETVRDALARAGIVAEWEHAQSADLVDWPLAYALRRMLWQQLHTQFKETPDPLQDDLLSFTERQGEPLRAHARTVAREILQGTPADDPRMRSASAIPDTFRAEMEFEIFAQWLAARCWSDTQHLALDAGQRIGLIHDLAVGCDATGSEAWIYRDSMLKGIELGAPPDAFNADGQCWGISTYSPWGLQATGFQHYIDLLRANMARGGGLRIDHILGLSRLWVVPQGESAMHGGYLHYPVEDMLRLLALESWRHQCIVIGEDLGTVPEGIRDQLAARGVLGTDVLLFMRDATGEFLSPPQWRHDAVATTTTHDLPPLLGWRAAVDIEQRSAAQGWPESLRRTQQQERLASVEKLDRALALWQRDQRETSPVALANQACMDYVLDTPAQLVLIPVEDVLGRKEQPNLPGTVHGYPNWRHRLPVNGDLTLQSALQRVERKPQRGMPP